VYADSAVTLYMRLEAGGQTLLGSIDPKEGEDKVPDPGHFNEGVELEALCAPVCPAGAVGRSACTQAFRLAQAGKQVH
jgi:hypothetical protein